MVAMANSLLANIVAELEGVSSASKDFSRYISDQPPDSVPVAG